MMIPSFENPGNNVDQHGVSETATAIKVWDDEVCIVSYDKMIYDAIRDVIQATYPGVSGLYTHRHSVDLRHLCICIYPLSPILFPSSLCVCTPTITQSCAKLSAGSGERWIFQPHWRQSTMITTALLLSSWYALAWANICIPTFMIDQLSLIYWMIPAAVDTDSYPCSRWLDLVLLMCANSHN
jgi:hypothetical protein